MEVVYFAGGCLWGVQAFIKTLPGVKFTEAGRLMERVIHLRVIMMGTPNV